ARTNRQARAWHDSLRLFNQTLAVNPTSLAAHSTLGYLLRDSDPVAAEAHDRAALQTRPTDPAASYNLANLLLAHDRPEEALAYLESARRILPNDANILNSLGVALIRSGRTAEAIDAFRAAVANDPNNLNARARANLARAQRATTR